MTLAEINGEALSACCGSRTWVAGMLARRPFTDAEQLLELAVRVWWTLEPGDWLEAFSAHPQIGQQTTAGWAHNEQSGMALAGTEIQTAMADLNRRYREHFGYIFITCATGKTAEQMLAELEGRMKNEPADELANAAAEQAKILTLRLKKLLAQ